ncbi:hypothetical protein BJ993_002039 [Nocardioides aromaticivorans]|uniref:Restriction endonuclease type IV Mrr domain-containing protein n=1 Tax=Nocardioides aromaticivorans TaxID=200618 RepID=A0A7Y9ZGE1_9ACTN|nr:hypothetical protein [Nocardioides aromaticivorans]NYI44959.1 hypothetical protein [Nocardioides aromaticivorans]
MRDGIDWAEVGAGGRFEKIVGVLLSTLNPGSRRIDGAGGDGGRDHQFHIDGQLLVWQSKYFLGRLSTGNRKRQITESLITAAALQPDHWTLVTPMVPTPEELAWFNNLQPDYPFPLAWCAGDWLEAQLAGHPQIVRHFMGANDQYVQLLRELQQEQDALVDGLPAARPRLEAIAAKVEASDPFYSVAFTIDAGQITSASLRPKYVGAELDSPITLSFNVVSGTSPADQEVRNALEAAFEWGEPATLPATHVRDFEVRAPHGLGGSFDQANITLTPEVEAVDLDLELVVWAPDGRRLATLPARLVDRSHGRSGTTVVGSDSTGIVTAKMRLDHRFLNVKLQLTYEEPPPLLPGALLPVVRFMRHATAPNRLSFGVGDAPPAAAVPIGTAALPGIDSYLEFVEGLDRIQSSTGHSFPTPAEWSSRDLLAVRRAVTLLAGGAVKVGRGPARIVMEPDAAARFQESTASAPAHRLEVDAAAPYIAQICGRDVELGPYLLCVDAETLEFTPAPPGEDVTILAHPFAGRAVEAKLGQLN